MTSLLFSTLAMLQIGRGVYQLSDGALPVFGWSPGGFDEDSPHKNFLRSNFIILAGVFLIILTSVLIFHTPSDASTDFR